MKPRCRACNPDMLKETLSNEVVGVFVCPKCASQSKLFVGAGADNSETSSPASPGCVVVATADQALFEQTTGLVAARSFRAECAPSAATVLKAIPELNAQLVVLDLALGDAESYRVLRDVRNNDERFGSVPILVVSEESLSAETVRLLRLMGASGFLRKNMLGDELLERVDMLVEQYANKVESGEVCVAPI